MNIRYFFCDALHWLDEHVLSSSVTSLAFGMCCSRGKIRLPSLQVPLQPLYNLFTVDMAQARDFQSNIVQYNASLAFTSLGVKVDETLLNRGPPVFQIHGELRHLSGSLLPEEFEPPCYSQLYIYDATEAYHQRITRNDNLSLHMMHLLQQVLTMPIHLYITMLTRFFACMMVLITWSGYVLLLETIPVIITYLLQMRLASSGGSS